MVSGRPGHKTLVTLAVIPVLLLIASMAFSMDWPVENGRYNYGFGAFRGRFLPGLELPLDGSPVIAPDDGELIFHVTGSDILGSYPVSGDSLLVLQHNSGLLSIYSGLVPDSLTEYLKSFRKGDILGKSPQKNAMTIAASYMFDNKDRRFINPLILMPPLKDDKTPVLRNIALVGEGQEYMLDSDRNIRQGSYKLVMEATDLSPGAMQSACWEIRILIDGSEKSRVQYDAAWASGGKGYLFGSSSIAESSFFAQDGRISFGPYNFSRGRLVVTIIAMDYAQNKREQSYSLSIF